MEIIVLTKIIGVLRYMLLVQICDSTFRNSTPSFCGVHRMKRLSTLFCQNVNLDMSQSSQLRKMSQLHRLMVHLGLDHCDAEGLPDLDGTEDGIYHGSLNSEGIHDGSLDLDGID